MFSNKPTLYKYRQIVIYTHTRRQIDRTDIEKNITTKENNKRKRNRTKETKQKKQQKKKQKTKQSCKSSSK